MALQACPLVGPPAQGRHLLQSQHLALLPIGPQPSGEALAQCPGPPLAGLMRMPHGHAKRPFLPHLGLPVPCAAADTCNHKREQEVGWPRVLPLTKRRSTGLSELGSSALRLTLVVSRKDIRTRDPNKQVGIYKVHGSSYTSMTLLHDKCSSIHLPRQVTRARAPALCFASSSAQSE